MAIIKLFPLLLLSCILFAGEKTHKKVFVLDQTNGDGHSIILKKKITDGIEEIDLTVDGSNLVFFPDDIEEGDPQTYTLENGEDLIISRDEDGLAFEYKGRTHQVMMLESTDEDGNVFILNRQTGTLHQEEDAVVDIHVDGETHITHSWESDEDGRVKVKVVNGSHTMNWVTDEDGESEDGEMKVEVITGGDALQWTEQDSLDLSELDEDVRKKIEAALKKAKGKNGSGYKMKFIQSKDKSGEEKKQDNQ